MSLPIFSFIMQSSICAAIFFLYYLAVLKRTHTHQFNRWYLFCSVLLSVTLPLLELPSLLGSYAPAAGFTMMPVIGTGGEIETTFFSQGSGETSIKDILNNTYYAVAILLGAMSLAKIVWVACIYYFGSRYRRNGVRFVESSLVSGPFSFVNTIFWPAHLDANSAEGTRIITHELAHIRQWHTFDKLIVQTILCICWLNPVLWFVRRELWLQHEFIADNAAIENNDSEAFARMLLYSTYKIDNNTIVNFFYHSPIKRRLNMILNNSKGTSTIVRCVCAPLALMLSLAFLSFSAADNAAQHPRASKKIVVILDAGHGGIDIGANSNSGHQEKDITLAICKKIEHLANEYNIEIIPTRTGDEQVLLENRVKLSNNKQADIFLSVHLAKNDPKDAHANDYKLGISSKNSNYQSSQILASAIAGRLKSQDVSASVSDYSKVFVIRESAHTAVLLECGNINDPSNVALILDDTKLELMCRNVLSGIVDYEHSR
ncbi:M56/M15 family metallopeptidase [Polluticoccus soli]|uniref:M56/M15 family metallopeptidase n=1 Tax=Polluticoccus soli TaxID=3034150 RepID=UPI0023E1C017|nr:M56/M15 family metallopeptidase [Flavipsychrobacter sp. JY13-12]